MASNVDRRVGLLLDALDEAFERRSWHGTNLRGSIRGVTVAEARWRPALRRHNIWEIVLHAAYWKYAAWRKLKGAARGSFPLEGSNWFARPARGVRNAARAWADEVKLLIAQHRQLRDAVAALDQDDLDRPATEGSYSRAFFVRGIAAHDLYHAGQIQLLKRLQRQR